MANYTIPMDRSYLKWRSTVAHPKENLIAALEKMTASELYAAHDRLMSGLVAERLNPGSSHGNFDFASGVIRGLLYKRGHKVDPRNPTCNR